MAPISIPSIDLSRGFSGKMLVAQPHLEETPFGQSVVLMCSHDEDHAFGIVVNKPMDGLSIAEIISELDMDPDDEAENTPVYFGGPVEMERGAVLHSLDYIEEDTITIAPGIGLTATQRMLRIIGSGATKPRHYKLLMGHAGWSGGQLENEIKRNDWLSIPASRQLIFGPSDDAWTNALVDLGIRDLTQFDGNESPTARPN